MLFFNNMTLISNFAILIGVYLLETPFGSLLYCKTYCQGPVYFAGSWTQSLEKALLVSGAFQESFK